jgi:hypothetical protein
MKKLLVGAIAVLALLACAHADTIIGTANNANCIPISCPSITGGNYQQIYNSGAFGGSIDIGTISFYNTYFNDGSSQGIATMDYSLYLAVTSQSVPNGGLPPGDVLFASGHLNGSTWPFGDTLTFTGTPFLYDPSQGNLELTMVITNASDPSNEVFTYFDSESGGPFSRWCPNCGSGQGYGLVTGFGTASGSTPEPSSLLLTASGFLAAAGAIRRKWAK